MGASIYYQPATTGGKLLNVGLRSTFVEQMVRLFGEYPWKLNGSHIERLVGLKAAWDGQDAAAFDELIAAIYDYNAIEVWPEY